MHRLLAFLSIAAAIVVGAFACSSPTPATQNDAAASAPEAGSPEASAAGDGSLELVAPVSTCTLPSSDTTTVNTQTEVAYGPIVTVDDAGDSSQTLDIVWPMATGMHPLVVMIHGGGWRTGAAETVNPTLLANAGYATASLNYRLVNEHTNAFPAAVSDVRCALRWLRAHAADYSIDATRVAVMGDSAGGHLTAMLALATDGEGLDDGTCPASLAGESLSVNVAIGYYGPYDLTAAADFAQMQGAATDDAFINGFLGGPMDASPNAAAASPITYVKPGAPPMLLLHGDKDILIPPNQAPALRDALHDAGVRATWIELSDEPHGFPYLAMTGSLATSTCTTLSVLADQLRP